MIWFTSQHKDETFADAQKIAARLPEILLEAQKIATTVQTGLHGRRKPGTGDHFWQYRNYDPSADTASRIDWRQSARSDHLYVREQEDERAQTVAIWLDPSPSMHYTSDAAYRTKYEYGFLLANVLGYQLTGAGERLEYHIKRGDKTVVNHPKHLERFANTMLRSPEIPYFDHRSDMTVILISDFLGQDFEHLQKTMKTLISARANIFIVSLFDRAEQNFDFEGHIKFEDMQASDSYEIQDAKALQQDYQTRFGIHRREISSLIKNRDHIMSYTTDMGEVEAALGVTRALLSY